MKALPLIVAAVAFVVPIGFVLAMNLGSGNSNEPVMGTLHYFYAPG